jgi:hypothetical protein
MDEYFDEPELAGYQPHGDRPLRSPRLVTVMRFVVVLGLVGLILPGIIITAGTAASTAKTACAVYTSHYAPEAVGSSARFELVSSSGVGWNCYAIQFGGDEVLVAVLGIIPSVAHFPPGTVAS